MNTVILLMKTALFIMPDRGLFHSYIRRHKKTGFKSVQFKSMSGVTLIELTVVLFILVALAGVTIPMFTGTARYTECVATDATLANIRDAIMGGGGQGGYRSDMGVMPVDVVATPSPSSLNNLFNNPLYGNGIINSTTNNPSFNTSTSILTSATTQTFNAVTQRGWRGPYLTGGITCAAIVGKLNNLPTGSTLPPIDTKGVCGFSNPTPPTLITSNSNTVSLDSYPVVATNTDGSTTFLLQGSPIVLMEDYNNKFFLVSGGAINGIELTPDISGSNIGLVPVSTLTSRNSDDRVLYLDAVDPGSNQPCSK